VPVVAGGVVGRGEVGADSELLQDHGLAERAGQFAVKGGGELLPDRVVADRVDVRAEEVDERGDVGQPEPVVPAADLDAPGAVAEGERLVAAGRADRVADDPCPGLDRLVVGRAAAVEGHLVRNEPAGDGRVAGEAADHLRGEPRLAAHHVDVGVQVAAVPPGRVPVLAGHVTDNEGGDGSESVAGVPVKEVREAVGERLVDPVGVGHEVGPVEERPGHRQAVPGKDGEFRVDDGRVVVAPHEGTPGTRPEVCAKPVGNLAVYNDPCGTPSHGADRITIPVKCQLGPDRKTSGSPVAGNVGFASLRDHK
jgi:hypothetical protein